MMFIFNYFFTPRYWRWPLDYSGHSDSVPILWQAPCIGQWNLRFGHCRRQLHPTRSDKAPRGELWLPRHYSDPGRLHASRVRFGHTLPPNQCLHGSGLGPGTGGDGKAPQRRHQSEHHGHSDYIHLPRHLRCGCRPRAERQVYRASVPGGVQEPPELLCQQAARWEYYFIEENSK